MRGVKYIMSAVVCVCLAGPVYADQAADMAKAYDLAESMRKSASGDDDLRRALEIQQDLFAKGNRKSLLRVAQLQLRLGETDEAMASFQSATDAGSGYARFLLAFHHARGDFGSASDPKEGLTTLKEMSVGNDPARAQMALADLYEDDIGGTQSDAFALYAALAETGNPRALWKHGRYLLNGSAVPADTKMAAESLRKAVDAGYDRALLDLASAQIFNRDFQGAQASLDRAVELDLRSAKAQRAMAHYKGNLGEYSDPTLGRSDLIAMAETGNTAAASIVLRNHERRSTRMREADVKAIVSALEQNLENGNRHSAVVLARAYQKLRAFVPNARSRQAALVQDHLSLLPKDKRMAESVSATYDVRKHSSTTRIIADMLEPASGEAFVQAAMRLRGHERTSFVYLVQKELAALDAYRGAPSGRLTSSTISAIFAYCRAQGIFETCKHGPVTYDSSLLVARAIGAEKQQRLSSAASN